MAAIAAYFVANMILTVIAVAGALVFGIIVIPILKAFFVVAADQAHKEELEKNWDRKGIYGQTERPNLSEKLGKFHSEIKEEE